jgi:hypothetical protein
VSLRASLQGRSDRRRVKATLSRRRSLPEGHDMTTIGR